MGRLGRGDKLATIGGWPGPDVGAIDPLLSHVQEHLRLKQRDSGPRSGNGKYSCRDSGGETPKTGNTGAKLNDPYASLSCLLRLLRYAARLFTSSNYYRRREQ